MPLIQDVRSRVSALHDNHKRIATGALLIGVLTMLAKAFVAAREMAIAWRFGIGPTVDAYQLALTIATWLPMMLSGVMAVVLVPRLVQLKQPSGEHEAFVAELNGTVILAGLGITVLTFIAAPAAAAFLASGQPAASALTSTMAAWLAPIAFLTMGVGYLSARLQARERFAYSVSEAVPAVTIALLTILPSALAGSQMLVAATIVGFVLQAILVIALVRWGDTRLGPIRFRHRSPAWRAAYGALLMMGVGQLLITASIPIDQAFAAHLGEGSVATLGYASRIVGMISGLAAIVLGRALLPVLASAVAAGSCRLARRQARAWSLLLLLIGALAAAALWVAAPCLVRLLFQRGAFSPEASAKVTEALRFGLFQLPPYFSGIALVQWFAATDRFRAMAAITAAALLTKIALNLVLAPRLGVPGIMLASAGMYGLTAALLALGTLGRERKNDRLPLTGRAR